MIISNLTSVANDENYKYIPFPDSNAVWSETYWRSISDETCPNWVYNKYALFNEDTIINGISYHKIYHTNQSEITKENSNVIGGIREDSLKRIYCYFFDFSHTMTPPYIYSNEEIKLYDFNINIGDTIKNVCFMRDYEKLIVKQIDTIKINNTLRKMYSFDPIPWVHWIEGIGNSKGLLFYSGDLPTNGMDNDLICMHENDTLQYYYSGPNNLYDDCVPSAVLDDVNNLSLPDYNVYPNPVINGKVNFNNLYFDTIELFSTDGLLINTYDIHGMTSFSLDVSHLSRGIYIYKLKLKGFLPVNGKLLVK